MGYEYSTQAKMFFDLECVCCGRPLTDAESIQRGMGPVCSEQGYPMDGQPHKDEAQELIREASIELAKGKVGLLLKTAARLDELGFNIAASAMRKRFADKANKAKILIETNGKSFVVDTPFRRARKTEFINAWRNIPGREFRAGKNHIPVSRKRELWGLLQEFFPGEYGVGPNGLFRITREAK